ncbi:MAG: c-type cytochrome [Deltaproteobacteria bacterium]
MKNFVFYVFAFIVFSFAITACGGKKDASATDSKTETVKVVSAYASWTPNFENGKKIYSKTCMTCHYAGVSNAPALQPEKYKLEHWQKRADKGIDSLMHSALNGRPGTTMVARGTCMDCTDQDLYDAIHYMYREAKATIK